MAYNQVIKYYQGYVTTTGNIAQSTDGISQVIQGLWGLYFKDSVTISGVCTDPKGNIYITDATRNIILKITQSGNISSLAGLSGTAGDNNDGVGRVGVTCANARFNYPTGICCDRNGDLYICDTDNHQIRKISNNLVTVVAGDSITIGAPASGVADGTGSVARFNTPYDIDIDASGVLYVADTYNNAIRQIKGGVVSTIAGSKWQSGDYPVWSQMTTALGIPGTTARFHHPYGIACSPNGFIYVSDTNNNVIKRIDKSGWVRIFSGSGTRGTTTGLAKTCQYQDLKFSAFNKSGDLFVVDFDEGGASRLVRVNDDGNPNNVIDFSSGTPSGGQYLVGVATNAASDLIIVKSEIVETEYSSSSSSSS